MDFRDRVVLITGSSRGIGAAAAIGFATNGAKVAVNYFKNKAEAENVIEKIDQDNGTAIMVQADVRDQKQIQEMVDTVFTSFGPIDTLVLNANMEFPVTPFVEYSWEDFSNKLVSELKSAFYCCKKVVPKMIENKRGCIIGVSSGLSRVPNMGFCAHSTAKSGLDAFMKSLAFELGPYGIRVNTVAPGMTLTDATAWLPEEQKKAMAQHTPLRRNATPKDVASAIMMIASEQADFITGTYIPVSGGTHML